MREIIFKISKDKIRAKSLFEMSKERLDLIRYLPKNKTFKIIEDYYEIIKELLTATMYIEGYKTLSHKKLIGYFKDNHNELDIFQIQIIDTMRRSRNGIVYYGEKITKEFLDNNEDDIRKIIFKLIEIVNKLLEQKEK